MPYCGSSTLVNRDGDLLHARRLKCRSWSCPDCEPDRRRRLIAEGFGGSPNTFLTLTIRSTVAGEPASQVKALSEAWRRVRLRAIRESKRDPSKRPYPCGAWPRPTKGEPVVKPIPRQVKLPHGKLPFLAVIEAHKSGRPHMHILARSYWIGFHWLSLQMAQLLDSPHVRVERINAKSKTAAYVSKYCGKKPEQFGTSKRYWKSQDYELRDKWRDKKNRPRSQHTDRWEKPILQVVAGWRAMGYLITAHTRDTATADRSVLRTRPAGSLVHIGEGLYTFASHRPCTDGLTDQCAVSWSPHELSPLQRAPPLTLEARATSNRMRAVLWTRGGGPSCDGPGAANAVPDRVDTYGETPIRSRPAPRTTALRPVSRGGKVHPLKGGPSPSRRGRGLRPHGSRILAPADLGLAFTRFARSVTAPKGPRAFGNKIARADRDASRPVEKNNKKSSPLLFPRPCQMISTRPINTFPTASPPSHPQEARP